MSATEDTTRSRLIRWDDPAVGLQAATTLSGLEYLQRIASGDLPPAAIAQSLGFEPDAMAVERGRVTFGIRPGEHLMNPIGSIHGGVAATLLDSAMGCAVHSTLPVGVAYSTLEIKINYVRAMQPGMGLVRAIGEVLHAGSRVATAEGRMVGEDGKLYAHGTTTCIVMRP